ncbi:hypothetical protein TSAR_016334 [Trichomalopsis sarcophagae]|uniref:Uncharacterized protein n=1 Tax=Trichomalopsis sarcophagae TaxID=543379 RepID=A0A232EWK6_9HYME|nr:hypothetical protein TSAR_016334 [Trichomalopsis sarcophagae]
MRTRKYQPASSTVGREMADFPLVLALTLLSPLSGPRPLIGSQHVEDQSALALKRLALAPTMLTLAPTLTVSYPVPRT